MIKIPLNNQQYNYLSKMFSEKNSGGKAILSIPDNFVSEFRYEEVYYFDKIQKELLANKGSLNLSLEDPSLIDFIVGWLQHLEVDIAVNNHNEWCSIENSNELSFVCDTIDYFEGFLPE